MDVEFLMHENAHCRLWTEIFHEKEGFKHITCSFSVEQAAQLCLYH